MWYHKSKYWKKNVNTKGKENQEIEVYTNHYQLLNQPNWVLYQYYVDFDPPMDSKRLRIALFNQHSALFDNTKAFDGMTLYALKKLPDEVTMMVLKVWI